MKRLLYLDKKSDEIDDIISGKKDVIVRGANIKKYPYKMIEDGYRVYFMNNNSEGIILASATVVKATFIDELDYNKRVELLSKYDFRLRDKKLSYVKNRRYISIFHLIDVKEEYALLDRSRYGEVDDWMIIKDLK